MEDVTTYKVYSIGACNYMIVLFKILILLSVAEIP